MAVLIDAYNVLHCTHILPEPWAMMSVQGLADLIERTHYADREVVIVCDGAPRGGIAAHSEVVQILYAGGGRDADTVIENLILASDGPRELLVVSNDNCIKRAATKRRAKAVSSESFLKSLIRSARQRADASRRKSPPPPANPQKLLDEMGLDPHALEQLEKPPTSADPLLSHPGVSDLIKDILRTPPVEPETKTRTFDPVAAERQRQADQARLQAEAEQQFTNWLDHFNLTEDELDQLDSLLDSPPESPSDDVEPSPDASSTRSRPPSLKDDTPAGTNYWLREFGFEDD